MKCVKCKKNIDDTDLFCGYCGINQKKFEKYIAKVGEEIHIQRDNEYNERVKEVQNKLKNLENAKQDEINTIEQSRWQSIGNYLSYNTTEGKVNINGSQYSFADIKGADVVKEDSYRIVTTETGKSKKHVSLGKAVVGGALFGPVGALAGGAMGKTTLNGQTLSNSIPTCNHIGVKVNINGFTSEIVVLNKTVDQTSNLYKTSLSTAQNIVSKLGMLSNTPVPKEFIKPEEEQSVLDYNPQIEETAKELQKTIADKPTYEIPDSYYE